MILKDDIKALIRQMEPRVRDAFLDAIQDMRDSASLGQLEAAIRARDVDAALAALNLSRSFISPFSEAVVASYSAGGAAVAAAMPRRYVGVAVRFDVRSPRAEAWAAEASSRLVVEILEPTREAVRGVIQRGLEQGRNPRRVSLDIVGRIEKTSNRRKGGVLGLSNDLALHVDNARLELSNPDAMRNYLTRSARDKRYDGRVIRALEAGKPLKQSDVDLITGRYSDRLLKYRGDRIARTEAMAALNAGRQEAINQTIDDGLINRDQVTKVWRSALDKRTRDTHFAMHSQTVPINQPFISPSGARLMYPCDTSLGARAAEVVQCRCTHELSIDF